MISKSNLFILLLFNSLLLFGSYNTPFINTDETLKLSYGMDKIEVENELGKPLYVLSGESASKKIIWIYEVRIIEIQSKQIKPGIYTPTKSKYYIPSRASGNTIIHSGPIHRIQVEFINNKVSSWGPIEDKNIKKNTDKIINNETAYSEIIIVEPELSNNSKKVSFFFDPKIMLRFDNWYTEEEDYYYYYGNYGDSEYNQFEDDTMGGSIGFHTGFKFEKYRIGLDCRLGSGVGIMLSLERNMNTGFNFLIGVGIDNEDYYEEEDDPRFLSDLQKIGVLKLEVSKNFGKLNLGIGTIPNFNEQQDSGGGIYLNSKIRLLN